MSPLHPAEKSLSWLQLILVVALLAFGLLVSFLAVHFLDPAAARGVSANRIGRSVAAVEMRQR